MSATCSHPRGEHVARNTSSGILKLFGAGAWDRKRPVQARPITTAEAAITLRTG